MPGNIDYSKVFNIGRRHLMSFFRVDFEGKDEFADLKEIDPTQTP